MERVAFKDVEDTTTPTVSSPTAHSTYSSICTDGFRARPLTPGRPHDVNGQALQNEQSDEYLSACGVFRSRAEPVTCGDRRPRSRSPTPGRRDRHADRAAGPENPTWGYRSVLRSCATAPVDAAGDPRASLTRARPHRSLHQRPPEGPTPPCSGAAIRPLRRHRSGGLIREYVHVA
jgi:hypothetical protein